MALSSLCARRQVNTFKESDPTIFAGGAHYVTDAEAKAARAEVDKGIRQQEMDEYLYKEQFKGLSAEEALAAGEGVQLGGEVVDSSTTAHLCEVVHRGG